MSTAIVRGTMAVVVCFFIEIFPYVTITNFEFNDLVVTHQVDSTATVTPKVQIVTAGQPAVFNCSVSAGSNPPIVQWSWIGTTQSAAGTQLYISTSGLSIGLDSRYFVDTSTPGMYNLIINVTRINDSGSYICQDNVFVQSTPQQTGQLLVLGNYYLGLLLHILFVY